MSARKDKQSKWQRKKAKVQRTELELRKALLLMEHMKDSAYHERNAVLALLARLALTLGWKVGVGRHPADDKDWEPDWCTILFFDSPAGQMSWHFHDAEKPLLEGLPAYEGVWDGHTTPEKYLRVAKCAAELDGVRKAHGVGAFVTIVQPERAEHVAMHFASDGTPKHPVSECTVPECFTDEPTRAALTRTDAQEIAKLATELAKLKETLFHIARDGGVSHWTRPRVAEAFGMTREALDERLAASVCPEDEELAANAATESA